jgi:class 3 adenylate cyclase
MSEPKWRRNVIAYSGVSARKTSRGTRGSSHAVSPGGERRDLPAVHRAIVVVDVEGFGDRRRTNANQLVVRRCLYEILGRAFDKAGATWVECDHEDRGDGVLVLVPPTIAKAALVESLPIELGSALCAHNSVHCPEEQIRLRMSVHAGEIHYDAHGVVGRAVNLAFRLLDAQRLREALAGSPHPLAIIASSWFFDEVIWHSATADPDKYHQARVSSKETDVKAWIRIPDLG